MCIFILWDETFYLSIYHLSIYIYLSISISYICIYLYVDIYVYLSIYIYKYVKSILSRAFFNSTISLLIFCLEDLSFFDREVLKSPSITVLFSIYFLKSSKIFLISWVLQFWVHIYVQCLCFLDGFLP